MKPLMMGRGEHQSLVLRSEGDISRTLETWPSNLGKAPEKRGFSIIRMPRRCPPVPRESLSSWPKRPQRPRRSSTPHRA